MKLTIVLTVYNKEPYLKRSFESLINQAHINDDDYEVLVVDDGSTDNSSSIIDDFLRKDKRLRVVHQDNQGLSMARNNGLDASNGDYVWFVDADDIITPSSVRSILDAIEYNPDLIPLYSKTEGNNIIRNCIPIEVKTGKDVLLCRKWEPCGVFYVFRKQFLKENSLRFLSGIYHEDSEFTPRMLYYAKKVVVIPEVLYIVIHEPNSITGVPRPKRAFDCIIVAEQLNSFTISHNEQESLIGKVIYDNISIILNNALSIITKNSRNEQKNLDTLLRGKIYLFYALLSSSCIKYHIEYFLFRLFPGHYTTIYKIMKSLG